VGFKDARHPHRRHQKEAWDEQECLLQVRCNEAAPRALNLHQSSTRGEGYEMKAVQLQEVIESLREVVCRLEKLEGLLNGGYDDDDVSSQYRVPVGREEESI